MYKLRYLFILVMLCLTFSGCLTNKPGARSINRIDSETGYEQVIKPSYKKHVNTLGAILNVSFMGIGAAGGYLATAPTTDKQGNKTYGIAGEQPNGNIQIYCAAGGAAAGYLISRLFMLHKHKPRYILPGEYPKWLKDYNNSRQKDYIFVSYPNPYNNDTSMLLLPREREKNFKPQSLNDLRIFVSLFPNSVYIDTAIMYVTPVLPMEELDKLLDEYAAYNGIYAAKVGYICRYKTESSFRNAMDKYKEVQKDDSIQIRYSQLVQTYPFAKDFISLYPGSLYFDDIYQRIYTKLSWDQLNSIIAVYPASPAGRALHARIQFFEMASTFPALHIAVAKYPETPYVIKPSDNVNTLDSAKSAEDRLKAYKPLSEINNINKVLANIPKEFLSLQNLETSTEQIEDLDSLTRLDWVHTDSSESIIDSICLRYAKIKGEQLIGRHISDGYDSGEIYKQDGTVLKGVMIKDRKDIIGFGEKINTNGVIEKGTFNDDGRLTGQGYRKIPAYNITQIGIFKDGNLNDDAGKIIHAAYTDSGVIRDNTLINGGSRKFNDGSQYTGNFLDAKFSGFGTFTWANGKKSFKGEFKDGKREGEGHLYFGDDYVVSGIWRDDCPDGEIRVVKKMKNSRNNEWEKTWVIRGCMVSNKEENREPMPFTDADVLERLPD